MVRRMRRLAGSELRNMRFDRKVGVRFAVQYRPRSILPVRLHGQILEAKRLGNERSGGGRARCGCDGKQRKKTYISARIFHYEPPSGSRKANVRSILPLTRANAERRRGAAPLSRAGRPRPAASASQQDPKMPTRASSAGLGPAPQY